MKTALFLITSAFVMVAVGLFRFARKYYHRISIYTYEDPSPTFPVLTDRQNALSSHLHELTTKYFSDGQITSEERKYVQAMYRKVNLVDVALRMAATIKLTEQREAQSITEEDLTKLMEIRQFPRYRQSANEEIMDIFKHLIREERIASGEDRLANTIRLLEQIDSQAMTEEGQSKLPDLRKEVAVDQSILDSSLEGYAAIVDGFLHEVEQELEKHRHGNRDLSED